MIKIARNKVQMLHRVFGKLANLPLPTKLAYNVKKMGDKIISLSAQVSETYCKEIGEKFGERDEKGELKRNPAGGFFYPDSAQKEVEDAEKIFGETELEIDRAPLSLNDLAQAIDRLPPDRALTASDLSILDPILTEDAQAPEEVTTNVTQLRK